MCRVLMGCLFGVVEIDKVLVRRVEVKVFVR